jgi:prepilin-type N-terminal cleavage/methylation domain-containing protein
MTSSRLSKRKVQGLTLVELLVVVGVVSVLSAIMLPGIKSVLTDRKSSQAAIMVKNYLESARARAVGRNRPVAVVFERLSSRATLSGVKYVSETATTWDPANPPSLTPDTNFVPYNTCIRLSMAEEPLPITQAILPVPLVFTARMPGDGGNPPVPTGPYVGDDSLADMHQGQINEVRIFQVTGPPNTDVSQLVGEYLITGSQISFGNSARRFSIVSPRDPFVHETYSLSQNGQNGDKSIWFSVMNELAFDGHSERAKEPYVDIPAGTSFDSFRIYTRPKPIFTQAIQLPRGMCVDLSISGFGKRLPGHNTLTAEKQPIFDCAESAADEFDYRVRFASDWIGNDEIPLRPDQLRPVYVVFSPEGQLSHVWANDRRELPSDISYQGNLTRIDATNDLFFHIGKIDRVTMPIDPERLDLSITKKVYARNAFALKTATRNGVLNNLTDLNSYVVRLSPTSGAISASPIVNIETQTAILGLNIDNLNFGDMVELTRRGTYNSNVTAQ